MVVGEEWVKSMIGENLPGENRILYVDGEPDGEEGNAEGFMDCWLRLAQTGESMVRRGGGGGGSGGGEIEIDLDAGQHQELSGCTTVGGSNLRWWRVEESVSLVVEVA